MEKNARKCKEKRLKSFPRIQMVSIIQEAGPDSVLQHDNLKHKKLFITHNTTTGLQFVLSDFCQNESSTDKFADVKTVLI